MEGPPSPCVWRVSKPLEASRMTSPSGIPDDVAQRCVSSVDFAGSGGLGLEFSAISSASTSVSVKLALSSRDLSLSQKMLMLLRLKYSSLTNVPQLN
jgi:hypothetical protein